jgi:hypothetical protein
MFARKLLTGFVTGGVALSVIGLTATSASAATDPARAIATIAADGALVSSVDEPGPDT